MKNKFYFLIVLFLLPLVAEAQITVEASRKVDSLFVKYNLNTPGVAVGVLKNGEFVFKKGFGTSNLEYGIPITEKSVFHTASVSKQFTAFAIYLLESRNLLSLEDDVRKYLPELPQYNHEIKVKHLLAHTSGLKEQFALLTLAGWDMTDHITTDHILKLAFAQKNLNFKPGITIGI